MAVNGGNGSSVNTVATDDFGVSELSRIGEQYNRVPYAQRELQRRHQEASNILNVLNELPGGAKTPIDSDTQDALEAMEALLRGTTDKKERKQIQSEIEKVTAGTLLNPLFQRQMTKAQKEVQSLGPRMRIYEESTRERLNTQAMNMVNREFSDSRVGGFVNDRINSQEIQTAGLSMSTQSSFEELAAQREGIMGQIGGIRSSSLNVAGSLIGDNGVDQQAEGTLKENAEKIKELASQLGPIAVAMKVQKEKGEDPDSKRKYVSHMGEKAQEHLDFERLSSDIRSGNGEFGKISASDLKKRETEAAQNLVKALDELRGSAGKSKEEIAKLAKTAEEAAEEFERVQEAKAAGAGAPADSWLKTGQAVGTAVANVAQLVGSYFQVLGINQPMAEMGNVSAYANIENQKYDSFRTALGGNMTERMNLGGWSTAHQFGLNRATAAGWKVGANVVGGGAGVVAGGLQTIDAIAAAPGGASAGKVIGNATVVTNIAGGIQATGESGLLLASSILDAKNKISTSQAETAGVNVTMDAVRKLNHIPGYQLQQYRDHIAGLYGGSMYMGSSGESFLNKASSGEYLDTMLQFGLSSEEVGSLSRFGAQNMGSMFDPEQILQSKRFENLGFGSAEDNMRRMMSLSAGSTQNPSQSMEKLLERAVSVGLDSSKSITLIAESTGAVAEQSAMQGFANLGDQISKIMLSAVDRNNPNQEMAAKQATASFQTGEQARNNRSASWHGMIATSRLQKELGLNWRDAYALQGFSAAQLTSLSGQSEDEIKEALFRRGFDGSYSSTFTGDMKGALGIAINSKLTSQAESGAGFAVGSGAGWLKHIRPWIEGGAGRAQQLADGNMKGVPANVSEAVREMFWSFSSSNPGGDPQAMLRDMLAQKYLGVGDGGGLSTGTIDDMGGSKGALAYEVTGGARQKTRAAKQALGMITDGSGNGAAGIGAVSASGRAVEGMAGEATWAEAAAKSAADFGESALRLDSASSKLTRAADALLEIARVRGLAGSAPTKELPKGLDTMQDKFENMSTR
jgi:hypothetical protein